MPKRTGFTLCMGILSARFCALAYTFLFIVCAVQNGTDAVGGMSGRMPDCLLRFIPLLLCFIEPFVPSLPGNQLLMGAHLHRLTVLHDQNPVRQLHGAQAVGHDDSGLIPGDFGKTIINPRFLVWVRSAAPF